MRKLFVLVAAVFTAALALPSLAAAHSSETTCNGTLTGQTISGDLVVPDDGSCTIVNSTVGDDVEVGRNAYFQATGSQIGDRVEGNRSLTIFIDTGTTVGGRVEANRTDQLFVFNATVNGLIEAWRSTDKVQVCGTTIIGGLHVHRSGRDILIGDPAAPDCAGNRFGSGASASVHNNNTDVELVISGNTFNGGNLFVADNSGTSDKVVQGNTGGNRLSCFGNEQPFTASGNTGWNELRGQCAVPPTECNGTLTGQTIPDDLVVPDNGTCTIVNSTVGDDVKVGKNAYFQATGSQIAGHVEGNRSQTIFVDTGSTVGDGVEANRTAQLFVFNSTVTGEVEAWRSTDKVQLCGNTIDGLVHIHRSGTDILVGDPLAQDCAGNTILGGNDVKVHDNFTDVELVVRGNTLQGGDLEVEDNSGPAEKFVQNNTGNGGDLECSGNEDPFTGTPNSGFANAEGQCAEV